MCAHIVIFICYIVLSIVERSAGIKIDNVKYSASSYMFDDCEDLPDCIDKDCPYLQVEWIFGGMVEVLNLLIIVLVTYMSV